MIKESRAKQKNLWYSSLNNEKVRLVLSLVSIWSLRSLRKTSSAIIWKPLSRDRSDRSDNDRWHRKSSISAILVAVIAGEWFPYDRCDRWTFFQRSQRSYGNRTLTWPFLFRGGESVTRLRRATAFPGFSPIPPYGARENCGMRFRWGNPPLLIWSCLHDRSVGWPHGRLNMDRQVTLPKRVTYLAGVPHLHVKRSSPDAFIRRRSQEAWIFSR